MILIHPEDYEVSFLIEENLRLIKLSGADMDDELIVNALSALQESNELYNDVTQLKLNKYEPVSFSNHGEHENDVGEDSSSIFPPAKQVKSMFNLRRPFIFALGSFNSIGWRTDQWSDVNYLVESAGKMKNLSDL